MNETDDSFTNPIPTDWKTFSNTKGGYSVSYPPRYVPESLLVQEKTASTADDVVLLIPDIDGSALAHILLRPEINTETTEKMSEERLIGFLSTYWDYEKSVAEKRKSENPESYAFSITDIKLKILNGLQAGEFIISEKGAHEVMTRHIFLPVPSKPTYVWIQTYQNDRETDLFLSSFKFIE